MGKVPSLFWSCVKGMDELTPIKGKGLVQKQFPDKVVVAVTADPNISGTVEGWNLDFKPFLFYVFQNGWLAAIVGYNGGQIIGNQEFEDFLIRAIEG